MPIQVQVNRPRSHSVKTAVGIVVAFTLVALLFRFFGERASDATASHQKIWRVYFSPNGGCSDAIVESINNAKQTVFVQAYSFTSQPIARALTEAESRGVAVSVILDGSQASEPNCQADSLAHSNVRTLIDAQHASNHNKVMIIDAETVITGSFNFTTAAEQKNAENMLVLRDRELAQRYTENWYVHAGHSQTLPPK